MHGGPHDEQARDGQGDVYKRQGPHHQYFFHVGAGGGLLRGALFRGKGGAYRLYQGIGQGGRPKRNNGCLLYTSTVDTTGFTFDDAFALLLFTIRARLGQEG